MHVIGGLGAGYGGPSYSVPRLCEALMAAGVGTALLSVAEPGAPKCAAEERFKDRRFAPSYPNLPVLRALRMSFGLSRALREEAVAADVVHNHGLWLMPNVTAAWAARGTESPLIVAPRGMLGPAALAFSRRKKWLFWQFLQGPAIRHAACFHATSEQEYQEIREFGIKNPVAVVPNGIDLPPTTRATKTSAERVVLSLGRIHPKKGLDRLLHAWARVERRYPDWRLRIVGPGEHGHDIDLRALAVSLKLAHASIEPPVYNDDKYAAFRDADIFVLPSLNENFGLTVAESLAAGTPVIATKGGPWAGLEDKRCGWWIDHGIDPLASTLERAMALPREELFEMGARGRTWMACDFGWDVAARKMTAVYAWAARGAARPRFVYLD